MTESTMLLWGVGLLLLSLLFIALEVMVPSGGLLAVLAGGTAIAAIVCFFRVDVTWGLVGLLAVMVLCPTAFAFALKAWPNTYFGRRMILGGDADEDDLAARAREERQQTDEVRKALIGARGVALTDCRPVGAVRIEGERVEVLAEGGMIPAGSEVRVTAVDGAQIKVRRVV